MFEHMRQVVEAGGATVEDIVKVTVWMKELARAGQPRMGEDVSGQPRVRPRIMEVAMGAGRAHPCDFMAVIECP